MSQLYIGLMSGTSIDGIDAALVDFGPSVPAMLDNHYEPFSADLRQTILSLCQPGSDEINRLGELDVILGKKFAAAVSHLLEKNNLNAKNIRAIGSHGQTIRHLPHRQFTMQIGDPNIIAAETGITTIADFRRRDMALGGQGAPLVPAFHHALFSSTENDRTVVNIGGIANLTLLPKDKNNPIFGFDTGPGNTLLDAWAEKHLQKRFDNEGEWAATGTVNLELLDNLLNDKFFKLAPPKSTGREYFNLAWLEKYLISRYQPADVQATLVELTARTIIEPIKPFSLKGEILICGGGVQNKFLMQRLQNLITQHTVESTQKYGVHPDWIEAMAFAWLAKQTLEGNPGNVTTVTGAKKSVILGGVYYA